MTVLPFGLMEFEKPTKEDPFPRYEPLNVWLARKAGIICIFERGVIFAGFKDALAYASRPNKKKRFGRYQGAIIGEVVWGDPRLSFMFFEEDQRAKNRKKKRRRNKHLKKVGIRQWQFKKYLQDNPLERFFDESKPTKYPPTEEERKEYMEKRLERMEKRDARKKQEQG